MELLWEMCVFTMKKISEMCVLAMKMLMATNILHQALPAAVALTPNLVVAVMFHDKLHPHYYLARYLELGFVSLFVPAYTCWAQSRTIRTLIRSIDHDEEDDDPAPIKPKPSTSCAQDSSIFYVLGINTMTISGKEWAAKLLIPYALGVALVTMIVLDRVTAIQLYRGPPIELDNARRKLRFARQLFLLYMSVSSVALCSLQTIPIIRLESIYKQKQQKKKNSSSSSSVSTETTAGIKQD